MKTKLLLATLLLMLAAVPFAAAQEEAAPEAAAPEVAAPEVAPAIELKEGDMAPDFSLPASDGNTYTLSQFAGKKEVVLAFFPKAFTPGCTAQCKSYAAAADSIDGEKVQYFMISVDSVEDQTAFAAKHGDGKFPILSDSDKATSTAYGVLMPVGVPNRWTFYIDKEGKIAKIDKKIKPNKAAEDMLAILGEMGVDAAKPVE